MHTIYRVSLHSSVWFSWTCQGDLKYSALRLRRNKEEKWIQWMIQYPTQTKQTKYLKLSVFRQYNYKYRKCVLNIKFEWSIITQHKLSCLCKVAVKSNAEPSCLASFCQGTVSVPLQVNKIGFHLYLLQHELKSLVMKLLELEKIARLIHESQYFWVKMYQAKDFCLIRYKVLSML